MTIVIAGLAVTAGLNPRLGPLAAAYVLILAIAGPLLARTAEPLARTLRKRHGTPLNLRKQLPKPSPDPAPDAREPEPNAPGSEPDARDPETRHAPDLR